MTLRFGTDGVRGVANAEVTPELALSLGRAAARVLGSPTWVLGRDPRLSGPILSAAFAAGLASEGVGVVDLGVLPTPGVAHRSAVDAVPGAVLSASHNPFADNGIKVFAAGGRKLDDATETLLESELDRIRASESAAAGRPAAAEAERPTGVGVGSITADPGGVDVYAAHLEAHPLAGRRLTGLRVVVDCANGAASEVAPRVLTALGAEVTVLHAEPDGTNINAGCGSTHPESLQQAVVTRRAHCGLAFDGDADRVLAVDAEGRLVDGDQIIAVCAVDLHERGELADDAVVVTVMTNLGFRQAMAGHGIRVVETPVGDRHVIAALEEHDLALGGEQSGHVIFRDLATTGDGILTGLRLLDVMVRHEASLASLAAVMTRLPQVLVNVRVAGAARAVVEAMAAQVAAAEAELGETGRVLVRASGTEPLVRVMVEAPTREQADRVAADLAAAAESAA